MQHLLSEYFDAMLEVPPSHEGSEEQELQENIQHVEGLHQQV